MDLYDLYLSHFWNTGPILRHFSFRKSQILNFLSISWTALDLHVASHLYVSKSREASKGSVN